VADLIILVIAANEGVKPQTLESLQHIEAAKLPFLVAINKMDLPEADLNKVKSGLAEAGVLVEGYGGKVVAMPVSAKTGEGLNELLDLVLLMAEMQEIKADREAKLEAVIIESKRETRRGIVASLLVRNGSLRVGEQIEIEGEKAKIKMLLAESGQKITVAEPGQVVEVLGFKKLPVVGAWIGEEKKGSLARKEKKEAQEGEKKVKIILKTDAAGMLEAIEPSLPEEAELVDKGVGAMSDSDILLAKSVGAEIIGFNVKVSGGVAKLAETEGVKIKNFQLIYDLLEYLEKQALKGTQPAALAEQVLGRAEILAEFKIKEEHILGAKVTTGEIKKTEKMRICRGEVVVGEARVKSLKKDKMDVLSVEKGEEFGAVLSPDIDFELGDLLISYRHGSN
jgi:translation initiation factor IF-2